MQMKAILIRQSLWEMVEIKVVKEKTNKEVTCKA